jgi:phage terminase large subunit-like protein
MGRDLKISFGDIATQYAHNVVEGRIIACKWVKLAAQRHLNDLTLSKVGHWKYVFNPELEDTQGKKYFPAERVCRFAELMPHIKGDWAAQRKLIQLEPWQIFILASIFGWVNRSTGKRRFRVADLFVPRKNAKSTIASIIGLYMFAVDGEFGAEVYSGATSQDQAMEVFRPARLMAGTVPEFRQRYSITVNVSNLSVTENNSKFEPVIGKPGDGASPSCAIVDEYHEHKTPELYETMQTGMGARSQPLMLVITTSGTNVSGPCYTHQVELQKILQGMIENDQRFGIIFTIDEDDDWTSDEALVKANPNFGISVDGEFLKLQQRDAVADPRKQNIFKTKHLNIWCAAASPWINLYNLQQCGDPSLSLDDFVGEECIIGLDLASTTDIASKVPVFKRNINGVDHFYAFSHNYVPESAVLKAENVHYQGWVKSGHLIETSGNMIDLEYIQNEILDDTHQVNVREVAKDQWGGQQLGSNLANQGIEVVDIPMQTRYLSEPMKFIAALIDADPPRFHHDGNPAFIWMMSNVEVKSDHNENIFPRKQAAQNKIDAAVALIVAMSRAMVDGNSKYPVIDENYELLVA